MTKFVQLFRYGDMRSAYEDRDGGDEHLMPASDIVRVSKLKLKPTENDYWVPVGGCSVYCILLKEPADTSEYWCFYLSENQYRHLKTQLVGV